MKLLHNLRRLRRNAEGVGAVEFALIAPLMLIFVIGIAQLGTLYMANASIRSSVAEGARLATVFRQGAGRPTDAEIIARINSRRNNLVASRVTGPTITPAADNSTITITMSYAVPLNFIFFQTPPVTLTETRVVPTYPPATPTPVTPPATPAT